MSLKSFLIDRLDERSTWRGIVMIVTALGVALTPEQAEAVITVGLAIVGALGAFTADKKGGKDAANTVNQPAAADNKLQRPAVELPRIELQARSEPGTGEAGAADSGFGNR